MRLLHTFLIITVSCTVYSQTYFPIKSNMKWGMMDTYGKIVMPPTFDAFGEFDELGYAVVQKNGKVGIINAQGQQILSNNYADIRVLSADFFAVTTGTGWQVINADERIVLPGNFENIKIINYTYLAFKEKGKWGLASVNGNIISNANFDDIAILNRQYFQISLNERIGVLSATGKIIIPPSTEEVYICQSGVLFYKRNKLWGAVDEDGLDLLQPIWTGFEEINSSFIKLNGERGFRLFSVYKKGIITKKDFDDYLPFSSDKILCADEGKIGLLHESGVWILNTEYDEIQSYQSLTFRVKKHNRWGIANTKGMVIPCKYEYISPLSHTVCVFKKNKKYGIATVNGNEVIPPTYDKIDLAANVAQCYRNGKIEAISFDSDGQVTQKLNYNFINIRIGNNTDSNVKSVTSNDNLYDVGSFEWFYEPSNARWGLREKSTGKIRLEPTFAKIIIKRKLGITVVAQENPVALKTNNSTFKFGVQYGIVNHETDSLTISNINLLDIKLQDFEGKKLALARCIFANGRHGLIDKKGVPMPLSGTYIGEFEEGVAKIAFGGRLAGVLESTYDVLDGIDNYYRSMLSLGIMQDFTDDDLELRNHGAMVCKNCTWGFVDSTGNLIVKPEYDYIEDVKNNTALAVLGEKWGLIGIDGKVKIPFQYDGIQYLPQTDQTMVRVFKNEELYGLIDTVGKAVVPVNFEAVGDEFSDGLIAVKLDGKWGFANQLGRVVIPCDYEQVLPFSEGVAAVERNRKWGFINKHNEVVIPLQYKEAGSFVDGLAWVKENVYAGFINKKAEVVIPFKFKKCYDFQNGVARVKENDQFGLINTSGSYISTPNYLQISPFDQYGLAIAEGFESRKRFSVINTKGNRVTLRKFNDLKPFSEGMAIAKVNDKYGFIDTTGNLVIDAIYSKVLPFSEGVAAVMYNGNWGFIDNRGNWVIDAKYTQCRSFKNGKAVVYKGFRKAGLITKSGEYIIEPSVQLMLDYNEGRGLVRDNNYRFYYINDENRLYKGYFQRAESFQNGVAAVKQYGKWGLINHKGIELITPKYDIISDFKNGIAKVRINSLSGIISTDGKVLAKPQFEYISYAGDGLFRVEQGDRLGYFDANGKWVWDLKR